ncbi:hypothetical protein ACFL4G_01890, partial [Thermodesulfobacteriota bacterium]
EDSYTSVYYNLGLGYRVLDNLMVDLMLSHADNAGYMSSAISESGREASDFTKIFASATLYFK